MDNVKAIADAGKDFGEITRAFNESFQQNKREKISAFRRFKQELLDEEEKEIQAEFDEALKEVSDKHLLFMSTIKHQEKLRAEEITKREMEK